MNRRYSIIPLFMILLSAASLQLHGTSCTAVRYGGGLWKVRPGAPVVISALALADFKSVESWRWSLRARGKRIYPLSAYGWSGHHGDLLLFSPALSRKGTVYELLIDEKPACETICRDLSPGEERRIKIAVSKSALPPPSSASVQDWQITGVNLGEGNTSIGFRSPEGDMIRKPYYLFSLKDVTANDQRPQMMLSDTGLAPNKGVHLTFQSGLCGGGFTFKHGHSYQLAIYEIYSARSVKVTGWRFAVPEVEGFSPEQIKEITDYNDWILSHNNLKFSDYPDLQSQFQQMYNLHGELTNRYGEASRKFTDYSVEELHVEKLEVNDLPALPF